MSIHFDFSQNDWRSLGSRAFAEKLRLANPVCRDRISRQFGLTLAFDIEGLRVDYDGRKVGFGSFSTPGGRTTFSIAPKVDDFDVTALFNCIDSLSLSGKVVQLDGSQDADVQSGTEDQFSWSFFLGLLEEINLFGVHNFLIFNSKKVLKGRTSVTGRPIAKSLVMNMARGRFGVDCEVLDNYKQRQYASLFFATAKSIVDDLKRWQAIVKRSDAHVNTVFNSISAKLKHFSDIPFSPRLLLEVSTPPYTYGVKALLLKCLRYWRWKGIIASSESRQSNPFWSISVALDTAFEVYAGEILSRMLVGSTRIPKATYAYSVKHLDSRFPRGQIDREIEPDHIFCDYHADQLLIAEIKYSNKLAVREHVAQLIAYLSFNNYPFSLQNRKGMLVYPGTTFSCEKIVNFQFDIDLVTLPANESFINSAPVLN